MKNKKQQNKKSRGDLDKLFFIAGIVMLICAGCIFLEKSDYILNGPKSLDEMIENYGSPINGEYVTVDVDAAIDWYAETQYKIFHGIIPAGKKRHAIIWLKNDAMMGITVKGKKNIEKIDAIIDGTWQWCLGESGSLPTAVSVEGKLTYIGMKQSEYYSNEKEYVKDSLGEYKFYELEIDTTDNKYSIILQCILLVVFGIVVIVASKLFANNTIEENSNGFHSKSHMPKIDFMSQRGVNYKKIYKK